MDFLKAVAPRGCVVSANYHDAKASLFYNRDSHGRRRRASFELGVSFRMHLPDSLHGSYSAATAQLTINLTSTSETNVESAIISSSGHAKGQPQPRDECYLAAPRPPCSINRAGGLPERAPNIGPGSGTKPPDSHARHHLVRHLPCLPPIATKRKIATPALPICSARGRRPTCAAQTRLLAQPVARRGSGLSCRSCAGLHGQAAASCVVFLRGAWQEDRLGHHHRRT
ncbi:hypothetical protein PHLGIDRAFT_337507 [Phlebiopsis gigantea 11061_1 CR5-6]|uniref:Uncharacterized protein n=1 Tax=Phlebiopsis gigantea (strain 11061_1 CR5-6) TaxID=745531 RepID=A0A0C3NB21_PHLG1|nr:hypothetical protein PHLGIDRAFT_337507 [Phlebiopsis gigantea 11061_1 CR5-6]